MLLTLCPQTEVDAALAYMRAHLAADQALVAGRLDEAQSGFEHCRELAPESSTIAYALACVAARSGDLDRAFAALEDARRLGFRDVALAEWDEDLGALRDEPRFKALMTAIRADLETRLAWRFRRIVAGGGVGSDLDAVTTFAESSTPGDCVVVGDSHGRLQRLDPRTGALECTYRPVGGCVWRVAVHPLEPEFVVLTTSGKLAFFRCDESEPFALGSAFPSDQRGPEFPFRSCLEYSPDGERLVTRSDGRGASVWTSRGTKLFELEPPRSGTWYVDLGWTADGSAIARREDEVLWLHDAATGAVRTLLHTPSPIHCAAFDPTGERLATGHDDGSLRVWDARTLERVGEVFVPRNVVFDEARHPNTIAFTLDGERLAFAACEGVYLGVLDSRTAQIVFDRDGFDGHWCEPVGLLTDRDLTRVWFSPGCAGAGVEGADSNGRRLNPWLRGRTPSANASGLVAFAERRGVAGFDVERGCVLWFRPTLEREDFVQANSGHFARVPTALSALAVAGHGPRDASEPLHAQVTDLFDPKRVRASLAGVELVLWR